MNKKVCISIKALYEAFPDGELSHTNIVYETDRDINGNMTEYYDLRSNDGDLVCMDGEEVTIIEKTENTVTFQNDNGEETTTFTLNRAEYEAAVFEATDFTTDELLILSDGVLRLIQDASTAQGLIREHSIQLDITKHIEKLQALNTKICGYMR